MKFYYLKVGGTTLYNYNSWNGLQPKNAYSNLKIDELPNFIPIFEDQVLEKIPSTDFIKSTFGAYAMGFLVNSRVKKYMNGLLYKDSNFYPIKMLVEEKKKPVKDFSEYKYSYEYLHIATTDFFSWINFEKSIFNEWHIFDGKLEEEIRFNSETELREAINPYTRIGINKLFLNTKYKNQDIFTTYPLGVLDTYHGIVVSEIFKEMVLKKKLTGIDKFIEIPVYIE